MKKYIIIILVFVITLVILSCDTKSTEPEPNPVLSVNPTNINLGTHPGNYSFSSSFIIKNTGGGTLTGNISETASWITSLSHNSFSLTANQQITVTFSGNFPTNTGSFNTNININSNVNNEQVYVNGIVVGPKLYFSSTEYNTSVDSYVQITVKIDNVENLFACSMVIQYTTSKVDYEVGSLTAGSFWPVNLVKMSKEDGVGLSVCVGLKQTTVSDGITGSGSLFSFRLEGKNTGETALTITNVYLLDEDANDIENFDKLEIESSKVVVS